jgi:O-methyltransferase involved in polyketide biosynthesis
VKASGLTVPENVNFLPVDFERADLSLRMTEAGIKKEEKTVFSWLGVTMYLTHDAILKTLSVCSEFCSGSKVILTYSNYDQGSTHIEDRAKEVGEVWLSKFSNDEIQEILKISGFSESRVVTVNEIYDLYFKNRKDRLVCPMYDFIAVGTT